MMCSSSRASRWSGRDTDQLVDVYDARVDGGLSAQDPSLPPVACAGDGCKPSPSAGPAVPVAATVSFSGPGNQTQQASAPPGTVKITHRTLHGSSFVLSVSVPGAGMITASGADVRRVSRRAGRAGSYRVTVSLSAAAKRALKRKHRLSVTVTVRFSPSAGQASVASVRMTVFTKRGGRS